VSKALIAAALLALGVVSLLQQDTSAMAVPASGVQPAVATPAIAETVALRKGRTATRRVAVRHRGTVRTHRVASAHRRVAVRTRHVAVRPRAVAARRTHVATAKRAAVAVKSAEVVRPVRPWVQQPYYGAASTVSYSAPSLPPTPCRRRRRWTCAGIGRIPPARAATGISANSKIGSHGLAPVSDRPVCGRLNHQRL